MTNPCTCWRLNPNGTHKSSCSQYVRLDATHEQLMVAEAVDCPVCEAKVGEYCIHWAPDEHWTSNGVRGVHQLRIQAGERVAVTEPPAHPEQEQLRVARDSEVIDALKNPPTMDEIQALARRSREQAELLNPIAERSFPYGPAFEGIEPELQTVETPFGIASRMIRDFFDKDLSDEAKVGLSVRDLRALLIEAAVQNGWNAVRVFERRQRDATSEERLGKAAEAAPLEAKTWFYDGRIYTRGSDGKVREVER